MQRLGYYVEGKYFAGNKHQAIAFATNRSVQFGRTVRVSFKEEYNRDVCIVFTTATDDDALLTDNLLQASA